ncbi:MAG: Methylase involved in ubiquinone/menaquinone biosynthesis [Candidatus Magasanikbacteria bacterium GW2011_GWC2_41_17]|uniref:Methylase involved in ubiquinone/menaquinone biosynthesis n=2 Tax=Candidatus Magasanikiibacteriota TaxID=1752731 RepID=A0A0G0WLI6_9BACT|nr:MAG: Methylase involved in ubiquinone/menaquinone biosynthesis [Candidatus Magasanikbacteria bacterium GW2011_GWC2_41_17]KKS13660.1 MAG: Methylase involved in ubiquinone/menaquinone biosynthesis [Candidatus Magasanikbacteria bacterium GW2011_GWA2_41_55]
MSSTDRFGYEWNKYSQIDSNYELQFKRWVAPLTLDDFKDKTILDAGCGMGRNSYWSLKWGAKNLVAFDYDERSVEAARINLSKFGNAQVLFKSIYEIDWREEFDLIFSIGVIHHLKDTDLAIRNLVRALKSGGKLLLWVYSYDGNEWIVKLINPVREKVTSKLPVRFVYFLSYFCSVPLWIFVHLYRGSSAYLRQLATFKFWHLHSIVFDQLIPEVANYWTKQEARGLLENAGLKAVNIYRPENNCGWTVVGIK